jgi:putative DNA primase/helicase
MISAATVENDLLKAALYYASLGWSVFPIHTLHKSGCCTCGNPKCTSAGKHPMTRNGLKDAAGDPNQIIAWWTRWPNANIGIATGGPSGFWVLDVDGDIGQKVLEDLVKDYSRLPDTVEAQTGGGGRHFLFRCDGTHIPNSSGKVGEKIDVRGDGGYIVAAPSLHKSGRRYAWAPGRNLEEITIADAPAWLVKMATKSSTPSKRLEGTEQIEEGGRNDTLFRMGCSLRDKGFSYKKILALLTTVNESRCNPPLARKEVEAIAKSSTRYEPSQSTVQTDLRFFRQTDVGNAQRLVTAYCDKIRYCFAFRSWLIWDGKRWAWDESGQIIELAKDTIVQMRKAAKDAGDETLEKWAKSSETRSRITAMIELAQSLVPVQTDELDTDLWLLNCQNGIVDLRTGQLLPHDPKHLMTRICAAKYLPDSVPGLWEQTVTAILPDPEVRAFVQRVAGYSLTGSVREEKFLVLHGDGGAGKGTLMETLAAALGDYSDTLSVDVLLQNKTTSTGSEPTPEIAKLPGVRLLLALETGQGRILDEAKVKALTGGDRLTARRLRCDPFNFMPAFKLWLSTNHIPRIRGTDEGIWRRFRIVPFKEQFRDGQRRDSTLKERLRDPAVLSEILSWAVAGCLSWQREGLNEPAAVIAGTEAYRQDCDTLEQFISDECTKESRGEAPVRRFYHVYKNWCHDNGHMPGSSATLGRQMEAKGYRKVKRESGMVWVGIEFQGYL